MTLRLRAFLCLWGSVFALGACSTLEDALDYGRGPYDKSPASTSEAALEGLHESSWGNSGKWGAKEGEDQDSEPETQSPDPSEDEPPTEVFQRP